jgi:hypothetical protein
LGARHPSTSWRTLQGCRACAKGRTLVTVSADSSSVESRLSAGEMLCPSCLVGVLGGWGFARSRSIVGAAGRLQPLRARCRGCLVTHVLLPVVLLLRRAYLAGVVWAAVAARAGGDGHRRIGVSLSVPSSTVRGWLRRAARGGADRFSAARGDRRCGCEDPGLAGVGVGGSGRGGGGGGRVVVGQVLKWAGFGCAVVCVGRLGRLWCVNRQISWFWLKFREADGWSIAKRTDTRFVRWAGVHGDDARDQHARRCGCVVLRTSSPWAARAQLDRLHET